MDGNDSLRLQRLLGHEILEMTWRYVDMAAAMGTVNNRVVSPMDLAGLDRMERQRKDPKMASRATKVAKRSIEGRG